MLIQRVAETALMMATGFLLVECGHQKGQKITAENDTTSVVTSTTPESPDAISTFFGHRLVMNDSIMQQLAEIASKDPFLSVEGDVLKTGDVGWGINIHSGSIVLFTSVQPDDVKMRPVVEYLNRIYGKPYEDEEGGFDIKWSSSTDSLNIFAPGSTLVHLRRVHSEEGGTLLIF